MLEQLSAKAVENLRTNQEELPGLCTVCTASLLDSLRSRLFVLRLGSGFARLFKISAHQNVVLSYLVGGLLYTLSPGPKAPSINLIKEH